MIGVLQSERIWHLAYIVIPFNPRRYKPLLDQAITMSGIEPKRCIIYQRPGLPEVATMKPDRDVSWDEAMDSDRSHDCVPVEANQAMYILYTSGTTGDARI